MSKQRIHTSLIHLPALLLALGCGAADPAASVRDVVGIERDGAMPGGGDAGGGAPDAGAEPVAMPGEIRGPDGGLLCSFDAETWQTHPRHPDRARLAAAGGPFGRAYAFVGADGLLYAGTVADEGPSPAPVAVVSAGATPRQPLLIYADAEPLLAWRAGSDGGRAMVRDLADAERPPLELSGELLATASPALSIVASSDGYLAAFAQPGGIGLRPLAGTGAPSSATVPVDPAPGTPDAVQVAALAGDSVLAVWATSHQDGAVVMGVALDGELSMIGGPAALAGPSPQPDSIALAGTDGSAGLVYVADEAGRPAVKFRRVEPDGSVQGPLLNVVPAPRRGRDAALAPFGQGYAVVYRALPSPGVPEPAAQLVFIDRRGLVVYEGALSPTAEGGGPMAIGASPNGYVVVAWGEDVDGASRVRVASLYCPGALILCGGEPI